MLVVGGWLQLLARSSKKTDDACARKVNSCRQNDNKPKWPKSWVSAVQISRPGVRHVQKITEKDFIFSFITFFFFFFFFNFYSYINIRKSINNIKTI